MSYPLPPDPSDPSDALYRPERRPLEPIWIPLDTPLPPAPPKFQDRRWVHALLLLLTIGSTTFFGAFHYVSFAADFGAALPDMAGVTFWLQGLWYSATVLAILGCHEMGHYLACRRYDVDASLPFFLPAPLPLTGTLGAFIRIRQRIPTKVALFDIGIAGPLAGFVVAVPCLLVGLSLSHVVALPEEFTGFELGEPLLFQLFSWLVWGTLPEGYSLNMHPMAFASWFGLIATALNLFPIGQLDGGHIAYAVLGRRSTYLTVTMIAIAIGLTVFSLSWLVWTAMMVVMLLIFGPHHPPVGDEYAPLDDRRLMLAAFALLMFVLCFTPAPIEPLELIGGR